MPSSLELEHERRYSWKIFDLIAPTYDALNRMLSFGIDRWWRRQVLKYLPKSGTHSLCLADVATGTGDMALALALDSRVKQVLGVDMSQAMLARARRKMKNSPAYSKLNFTVGDACALPLEDHSFDVVTICFGLRNFAQMQNGLRECLRVLRPGGSLIILEFGLPQKWWIRLPYLAYFRYLLPSIGNLVSGHARAYQYLNQSVEQFPFAQGMTQQLEKAGALQASSRSLSGGIAYLYHAYAHIIPTSHALPAKEF